MEDFGFYLVMTSPRVGYVKCAEAAVRAGVKMLQLRMKHAPREEIVKVAHEVRAVTRGTATTFIVNDDPSIAAVRGATLVARPVAGRNLLFSFQRIVYHKNASGASV